MKLRLNTKNLNKPKPVHLPAPDRYASPVGWWNVSTEGDCEGRTTNHLGNFYGHVAEIAFHLADKCSYSLRFSPSKIVYKPAKLPTYEAKRKSVWISLDIDSNTWDMSSEGRATWFERWLNVTDPKIEVKGSTPQATYFASVYLELVEA